LLFTFFGAPLQAGTNLDDLLQRVESRYSAISDYVITASATAIGGPTSIAPTNGPGEFPAADHILLARFGSALRYQILSPGQSRPFVWIRNGQTTWQYRPYVNEYTETPSAPWPEHPGPGRDLPSLEWRYFARFREIKELASKAKLLKENERRLFTASGIPALVMFPIGPSQHPGFTSKPRLPLTQGFSSSCHLTKWAKRVAAFQ